MVKGRLSINRKLFFCFILAVLISPTTLSETFNFGVINERPDKPDHVIKQYSLFHKHLSQQLEMQGIKVGELVIAKSIDELKKLLMYGNVDGFLEGVMPVIEIQKTIPIDIGLLTWRKQQREYYSVFFARQDSEMNDLSQLDGKTIIFESHRSTSAFIVPKLTLERLGYQLNAIGQGKRTSVNAATSPPTTKQVYYRFAETEDNQAYWVHQKIGDIGAFNNGDWERVPEVIRSNLKIIGESKPIIRWLFAYRQGVPIDLRNKVESVLLTMHETEIGKKALKKAENILKFERLNQQDRENFSYWKKVAGETSND